MSIASVSTSASAVLAQQLQRTSQIDPTQQAQRSHHHPSGAGTPPAPSTSVAQPQSTNSIASSLVDFFA